MPDCLVTIQSRCRAGKGKKILGEKRKGRIKKERLKEERSEKEEKNLNVWFFVLLFFVFVFWYFFFKKEGKRTISEEVCELYDKNRSLACKSSEYM